MTYSHYTISDYLFFTNRLLQVNQARIFKYTWRSAYGEERLYHETVIFTPKPTSLIDFYVGIEPHLNSSAIGIHSEEFTVTVIY